MPRAVTIEYRFAPIPEELLYDRKISDKAVRIYGALVRHGMSPDDCYPSHARLAELIGCSDRSVQRPLRELEEAGWVDRVPRFLDSGERTTDGFDVRTSALSSAPTAQESAEGTRNEARTVRAPERDEREQENESHSTREDVETVFAAWQEIMGKPKARLTSERRDKIAARLKSYPIDDLLDAIRGCAASPFHMGRNDGGREYNDLTLIFRNDSKLEGFRDSFRKTGGTRPATSMNVSAVDEALATFEQAGRTPGATFGPGADPPTSPSPARLALGAPDADPS